MELLVEVFENLSNDVRGFIPGLYCIEFVSAKKYSELTFLSPCISKRSPVLIISTMTIHFLTSAKSQHLWEVAKAKKSSYEKLLVASFVLSFFLSLKIPFSVLKKKPINLLSLPPTTIKSNFYVQGQNNS